MEPSGFMQMAIAEAVGEMNASGGGVAGAQTLAGWLALAFHAGQLDARGGDAALFLLTYAAKRKGIPADTWAAEASPRVH